MEADGTGKYAGATGGHDPPDQAVCAGNGYVVEGVNLAWQFFKVGTQAHSAQAATPGIPLAQLFQTPVATVGSSLTGNVVGGTFLSDPGCYYDAPTQRWFLISLEIDETVCGLPYGGRAHNLVPVTKTSNPVGDYWLYLIDINDDRLIGTPTHPTCPCLAATPLLGAA